VGKLEEKIPLGRPTHRWEDSIKMVFKKWDGVHGLDRYGSEQKQVAGSCQCGNELSCSIKCAKFLNS